MQQTKMVEEMSENVPHLMSDKLTDLRSNPKHASRHNLLKTKVRC